MEIRDLTCLAPESAESRPLHGVRRRDIDGFFANLPSGCARFIKDAGFSGESGEVALLPGVEGAVGAVVGLGEAGAMGFAAAAHGLPAGSAWHLVPGDYAAAEAVLAWCLGAYRFTSFRAAPRLPALLVAPEGCGQALAEARAVWMARDLVNLPANHLGPAELAAAAQGVAAEFGAAVRVVEGAELAREFPLVQAVGQAAARPPRVVRLAWRGSAAGPQAKLVSLCGKGVCFDSGGLDLKPSSGMLRMKKDMGGAAIALGVARLIMQADLPVRLALRLGCVENAVAGNATRPLDVITARNGLSVEIANTDAEGRLVLADLLAEACEENPDLLIDVATLTGAARVALGPDLPALFSNDAGLAEALLQAGAAAGDPLWQLPLHDGYDSWLKSETADIANVSSRPHAGAIVAALFLRRFVTKSIRWAHLDSYAWNDASRAGRPEGGEAQGLRAIWRGIRLALDVPPAEEIGLVT